MRLHAPGRWFTGVSALASQFSAPAVSSQPVSTCAFERSTRTRTRWAHPGFRGLGLVFLFRKRLAVAETLLITLELIPQSHPAQHSATTANTHTHRDAHSANMLRARHPDKFKVRPTSAQCPWRYCCCCRGRAAAVAVAATNFSLTESMQECPCILLAHCRCIVSSC